MQMPEPEDNWQELKVGDKAVVKMKVPFYSGRVGTVIKIDEETCSYTVRFQDGAEMSYDGDDLYKVTPPQGRPAIYESTRFNLRELSQELVEYVDQTRGEESRRAQLEKIVREHKDGITILRAQGPGPSYVYIRRAGSSMSDPLDERNHMLLSDEQETAYQQAVQFVKEGNIEAAEAVLKAHFDWVKVEQ